MTGRGVKRKDAARRNQVFPTEPMGPRMNARSAHCLTVLRIFLYVHCLVGLLEDFGYCFSGLPRNRVLRRTDQSGTERFPLSKAHSNIINEKCSTVVTFEHINS
jgi:hypothetical protein